MSIHEQPPAPKPSAEAKAAFLGTEVSFDPTEPRSVLADLILRTVEAVNGPGPWLQSSFYLADVILAHGYAARPPTPAESWREQRAALDMAPDDYDVLSLPLTYEKMPPAQMWLEPMQRTTSGSGLPRVRGTLRGHWPRLGRREELPGESGPVTVTNVDLFETADGHLHRSDQQPACPPRIECTCPTGDGSLRWPCPAHPPLGTVIQ